MWDLSHLAFQINSENPNPAIKCTVPRPSGMLMVMPPPSCKARWGTEGSGTPAKRLLPRLPPSDSDAHQAGLHLFWGEPWHVASAWLLSGLTSGSTSLLKVGKKSLEGIQIVSCSLMGVELSRHTIYWLRQMMGGGFQMGVDCGTVRRLSEKNWKNWKYRAQWQLDTIVPRAPAGLNWLLYFLANCLAQGRPASLQSMRKLRPRQALLLIQCQVMTSL